MEGGDQTNIYQNDALLAVLIKDKKINKEKGDIIHL